MERPVCRKMDLCDVCGEAKGVYKLRVGLVCDRCMPRDLIPRCSELHYVTVRQWIRDKGYDPVVSDFSRVTDERSMGITQSDDVVLADELNARLRESDSLDMVVSFIKSAGLNIILDNLRLLATRGRVRVVTTAYMGVTESEAVMELASIPNVEVRMDLGSESRIHAKGFIFNSNTGGGTIYVGSANLSKAALTSGEEWVVKIREQDLPGVVGDFRRGFDNLWELPGLTRVNGNSRAHIEAALDRMGKRI